MPERYLPICTQPRRPPGASCEIAEQMRTATAAGGAFHERVACTGAGILPKFGRGGRKLDRIRSTWNFDLFRPHLVDFGPNSARVGHIWARCPSETTLGRNVFSVCCACIQRHGAEQRSAAARVRKARAALDLVDEFLSHSDAHVRRCSLFLVSRILLVGAIDVIMCHPTLFERFERMPLHEADETCRKMVVGIFAWLGQRSLTP